jgi:protein involved in polysaccharide export with SLBB domain
MILRRQRHCAPSLSGLIGFLALLLFASLAVAAQQSERSAITRPVPSSSPAAGQSDLARDNLNLVAASAIQLKEVLTQDPGLMVELKRWVAQEATDNGQIMSEEDLTDSAVFDRLARDLRFRSVATRVVQRYGYLLPNVNPGSPMGKEQDLLLKERVRRIVQMEAQEDSDSIDSSRPGTETETRSATCAWNTDGDCVQLGPAHPRHALPAPGGLPQKDLVPSDPGDQRPRSASPRILQAEADSESSSFAVPVESGAALQNISSPLRPRDNQSLHSDPTPDYLNPFPANRPRLGVSAGVEVTDEGRTPTSTGFDSATVEPRTSSPRLAKERESLPSIVRRPNPYADIPSLYDLYVQAPARDVAPERFGTAVFRDGLRDPRAIPIDLPVGPDYVVGPGDSLNIDLWGAVSAKLIRIVDRQGRVMLPDAGPLLVSGHSLGEIQQLLQKVITGLYRDTTADVSVSRLRTIRVYVVGEVEEPGAFDISSLSTALNALVAAGGVTAKGSLRSLKHMRGRQELEQIDGYDLLLHGVSPDAKKLESGDTLMVPPIGPEVTVTGMVRRPGVYELNGEQTVDDLLALAGGVLPAAALRHVEVQRLEAHEKRTMLSLDLSPDEQPKTETASFHVQDGDVIHIFPIAPYNQSTIYLQGHVLRPGRYSYHERMKFTDLIASYQDILPEPASHYAEIIRLNPPDFRPRVVSFDLSAAMSDPAAAPELLPLDTVRIFSRFDFEPPPTVSVTGEVRSPGTHRTSGELTLRDAVYLAGGLTADAALNTAQVFRLNPDGTSQIFSVKLREALNGSAVDNIVLQPRDRLLIHRNKSRVQPSFVEITGAVAKPGRYPYAQNMHAEDLIRAAGGLNRSADTTKADLTSYAEDGVPGTHVAVSLASLANGNPGEDVPLRAGDVLSIREKTGWKNIGASVKIDGEVMHPGTFGIEPGEKLSSVLERAGGYTAEAYPYAAVLTRRDVREAEELSRASLIQRVKTEEGSLQVMPEADEQQKNAKATALAQMRSTLHQLELNPPVGRVVIHIADPIEKWKNTPADVAMKDGDVLLIPGKTGYVMVNGQVFHPTTVSYHSGKSANWYLSQAGGLTPLADKKAAFVLRADGSVISARNNSNFFAGNPMDAILRSGDVVVVPEKALKIGGPNWSVIMQAASVAASAAIAVAYIHP